MFSAALRYKPSTVYPIPLRTRDPPICQVIFGEETEKTCAWSTSAATPNVHGPTFHNSMTIPKPSGQVGSPGRGGYNLKAALGWQNSLYIGLQKFIKGRIQHYTKEKSLVKGLTITKQNPDMIRLIQHELLLYDHCLYNNLSFIFSTMPRAPIHRDSTRATRRWLSLMSSDPTVLSKLVSYTPRTPRLSQPSNTKQPYTGITASPELQQQPTFIGGPGGGSVTSSSCATPSQLFAAVPPTFPAVSTQHDPSTPVPIPKPAKASSGNLPTMLKISGEIFAAVKDTLHTLAKDYLTISLPLKDQQEDILKDLMAQASQKHPFLSDYEESWVTYEILRRFLKNSSSRAKKRGQGM
ncbi:hypothetical protein GALMADRAFT_217681 [Galerina marginata CBS 339.88]|uniref:Uncharacterized protein n=1 Tax=Galerina marginata (strain CBS 339.88) TaxID=685588 RepID=A0A067SBF5_GALM3|nr:hypothetical protein GALMADRAFT_217681 [Galerina marginata CBS 339.88]